MKGLLISFEGIEGCGKSTQLELLATDLEHKGLEVVKTQEPGGTKIGAMIRKILLDPKNKVIDPMTELMLYEASRAQHLREIILPAIKYGKVVLCDRFSDSTVAYQGYGRGLNLESIKRLDILLTGGLRPSLTILLDIDPEKGLIRAKRRGIGSFLREGRMEREGLSFHKKVREGYLKIAQEEVDRVKIINADASIEHVQRRIIEVVGDLLLREGFRWH